MAAKLKPFLTDLVSMALRIRARFEADRRNEHQAREPRLEGLHMIFRVLAVAAMVQRSVDSRVLYSRCDYL